MAVTVGYGRGYYGAGQLAPRPQRRGGGWIKLAVVVGVGAVVWLMWPRSPKLGPEFGGGGDLKPWSPPPPPLDALTVTPALPPDPGQHLPPLDQLAIAQSRGYTSQNAYEDAVVASARQLQDTGARVVLAPHLQHLTARLGP